MTTEEINAQVARIFDKVERINNDIATQQQQRQFDDWALQQTMQASEQACMNLLNMNL